MFFTGFETENVFLAPPCSVESVFSVLPENVVPDTDKMNKTVPYNTTVKLTCAEDMIVSGEPVARCNRQGQWDVENVHCKFYFTLITTSYSAIIQLISLQ